ncbi:MAG TPA: tetratricopeptide repeat protein [bacterium]|nr:tetratricopeptide repeat protein [bacterium]
MGSLDMIRSCAGSSSAGSFRRLMQIHGRRRFTSYLTLSLWLFLMLVTEVPAQESSPESFDDLVRRGDALMDARKAGDALSLWEQARIQRPDDFDLRIRIGIARSLLGEWRKAENEFRYVLETNPNNTKALFNLALVFYNQGDYERTKQYLDDLSALDPKYPELNFHQGLLLEIGGDVDGAREYYIQEVNINPSCAKAWERLYARGKKEDEGPSPERCLALGGVCFLAGLLLLLYHRRKIVS